MHLAEVLAARRAPAVEPSSRDPHDAPSSACPRSRRPRALRWRTPSSGTTSRTRRAPSATSGPAWSPRSRTGRTCGRPGRRSRTRTLHDLASYLLQLEASLTAAGATVHWARDAAEANAVVAAVAKAHGVDEVVKVKSMATQEIGLNEALAEEGIAAWETDLAELIVQLGDDLPSHILVPAIHRNRAEIRQIFRDRMAGAGRPRRTTSPTTRPSWPAPPGCTCGRSSCAPRSPSPARTSPSPRPAPSSSSSPRATAGCA